MEKTIKSSEIETFVDERLAQMQKTALMFGTPETLELECLLLLEIIEKFCARKPRYVMDHYQELRHKLYRKCPGPLMLSHWLMDKKHGKGLEEKEAAHKVVDFFVELRKELKVNL